MGWHFVAELMRCYGFALPATWRAAACRRRGQSRRCARPHPTTKRPDRHRSASPSQSANTLLPPARPAVAASEQPCRPTDTHTRNPRGRGFSRIAVGGRHASLLPVAASLPRSQPVTAKYAATYLRSPNRRAEHRLSLTNFAAARRELVGWITKNVGTNRAHPPRRVPRPGRRPLP